MMHDVKVSPDVFEKLSSGEQTFLLALNQNFAITDDITAREFDDKRARYTDRLLIFRIASMESGAKHPAVLSPRFVILSLEKLPPAAVLT